MIIFKLQKEVKISFKMRKETTAKVGEKQECVFSHNKVMKDFQE